MATHTSVGLRIPDAAFLADLNGVLWDLRKARDFAELLVAEFARPAPNWLLIEPLTIAMTVTYARAFSGGVRYHLSEAELSPLSAEQLALHAFLRGYRDKHVAHSVNEFEENIVQAQYCVERVETEGITGIGCQGHRLASLDENRVRGLVEICFALEATVELKIQAEEMRLLPIVRAMPLDSVLSGEQKLFEPNMEKVLTPRKAPSNKSFKADA